MFNLSKHAQFADMLQDAGEAVSTGLTEPENVSVPEEEVTGGDLGPNAEQKQEVFDLTSDQKLLEVLNNLQGKYPAEFEAVNAFLTNNNSFRTLQNELTALPALTEQYNMQATAPQVETTEEFQFDENEVLNTLRRINAIRMEQERTQIPLAAFNLHRHKIAQMEQPMPMDQGMGMDQGMDQGMGQGMPMQPEMPMPQQEVEEELFPVANEGDFITKFLDDLLVFDNQPGSPNYERARKAAESIREAVSPGFEEEANSIIESVMQLDENSRDQAASHLIKLYEVLIPPMLKNEEEQVEQPMEPVMSQNNTDAVEGIVRFSLTDSVLNNQPPTTGVKMTRVSSAHVVKAASEGKILKTAADQFGQQYLLYGPTEKRICPKLRGKNMSVGDVVSEYTCRHHCIDGIVIDDNKTVCGEALWRANVMEKQTAEYVDADGHIKGGLIEKRFEVNHNVPEENQSRLKPGETRKPRPAAWNSTESRLQDMRSKEGQARDYRPETNTGNPFEWCHDVDQNNVQVSQEEKNRRQEAAGNKLVQYTNRDQGENNPKKAFNLKTFKTAVQHEDRKAPRPGSHDAWNEQATVNRMKAEKCPKCKDTVCRCGTGDVGDPQSKKQAQAPQSGDSPTATMVLKPRKRNARDTYNTPFNPAAISGMPQPADLDMSKPGTDTGKPMKKKQSGFNLHQFKSAENPMPITVPMPDIKFNDQNPPQDEHSPKVKPSKKKT